MGGELAAELEVCRALFARAETVLRIQRDVVELAVAILVGREHEGVEMRGQRRAVQVFA